MGSPHEPGRATRRGSAASGVAAGRRRCPSSVLTVGRDSGEGRLRDDQIQPQQRPGNTSLSRLAYMQRQRYWVERAFQEAKNEAGLDEYQARSWQAWHHHIALVMMALLFLLRERQLQKEALPLLSARDVKLLLAQVLPRDDQDPDALIRQIEQRHRQRQAAIDSAYRRQNPTGNLTK